MEQAIIPKDQTIVLGLLAHDCIQTLRANIPIVESLGNLFKDYHIVIYENNSTDGTKELLKQWQQNNDRVTAISEDLEENEAELRKANMGKSPNRIKRMAYCRNRVMEETRKRFSPDLFCFIDIDIESFSPEGIVKAIENAPADWGALFANGRVYLKYDNHTDPYPFPYDSYAFVEEGVNPAHTKDWVLNKDFHYITAWIMNHGIKRHAYLPCNSAFGGIGIYRWPVIKDLYYSVYQTPELKAANACMCEHIPFNIDIILQGYRLYIARDLKVCYWIEHPRVRTGLNKWKNHHHSTHYFIHQRRIFFRILAIWFKRFFRRKEQVEHLSSSNS